jgi:selenide,water dikinase
VLERILAGGLSKMIEANCTVIGGHSIRDEEIKFGYAVTGTIHPKKVLKNSGAVAGDVLVFTKSLGTGVISTAIKRGKAEPAWVDAAVQSMTTLNKRAAEVVATGNYEVHGMTDITGFGLIGHGREMALGSGATLRIEALKIPVLTGALECIRQGFIPAGLTNNREFAECLVTYGDDVSEELRTLLYDPQTAGGLLISVGPNDADRLVSSMQAGGVPAVKIGNVIVAEQPGIQVV